MYCDCLSALNKIENLLKLQGSAFHTYLDVTLVNLIARTTSTLELDVHFCHVYSHIGIWINEWVDHNIKLGRSGTESL